MSEVRLSGRRSSRLILGLLLAAGMFFSGRSQESASYVMDRLTMTSSAADSASASFEISVTFAQEGPAQSVSFCNSGFMAGAGFWSILGVSPVPVRLRVNPDAVDPTAVALSWSGAAPSFEVYRAEAPDSVVQPTNLQTVASSCSALDGPPPGAPIVFYLIRPVGI